MAFVVTGVKEIDKALSTLEQRVAKKLLRQSLRVGAKRLRQIVEQEAPVGETGALQESVRVKAGKRSRSTIAVNVQIGEGDFVGDTFYAAMVEYGTINQPAQGYMRRAFDQHGSEISQLVERDLMKRIEREIKKLSRK